MSNAAGVLYGHPPGTLDIFAALFPLQQFAGAFVRARVGV